MSYIYETITYKILQRYVFRICDLKVSLNLF
jgi:hypothetical protein